MNMNRQDYETATYLRRLRDALADAPSTTRDAAVDDVRAHLADAAEVGNTIPDALARLGTAEDFARQYRLELGLPERIELQSAAAAYAARSAGVLHLATVLVSVFTGAYTAFLLQAFAEASAEVSSSSDSLTGSSDGGEVTMHTLADAYGPGFILLAFIPAILALVPLVIPESWRKPAAIANAVLLTGFSGLAMFTIGGFYLPVAAMMWAAVIVPWRLSAQRGPTRDTIWRILGGIVIVLPGVLLAAGALSGAILATPYIYVAAFTSMAIAVFYALGKRLSAFILVVLGLVILVFTLFSPSKLALGFWLVGGTYLTLGILAALTWGAERERTA